MAVAFGPRRAIYVDITEVAGPARSRSPPPSWRTSRPSTSSTARSARCSTTTCRRPATPAGRSRRAASSTAILFDAARLRPRRSRPRATPTSSPTPPATRPWASTRCGRCATRSPASRRPALLPADVTQRLRLEDLLGFRRNPITAHAALPPLRRQGARRPSDAGDAVRAALDRRLGRRRRQLASASPSGARDYYGADAPRVHIVEGEGGLTPGRVAEALAAAGTASLDNVIVHVDWNQASIDSDHVCRDGDAPGDYVQWDPRELFYLHDWNVIYVPDGHDFQQVVAAQRHAAHDRTTASRRRSSTARSRAGSTASRARPRTAPATSSAPTASTRRSPSSPATPRRPCPPATPATSAAPGKDGDGGARGVLLGGARAGARLRGGARRRGRGARGAACAAARERLDGRGRKPRAGRAARRGGLRAARARRRRRSPTSCGSRPARRPRCAASSARSLQLPQHAPPAAPSSSPSADLLGSTSVERHRRRLSRRASGTPPANPGRPRCSRSAASARTPSPASSRASPTFGHHIGVGSSYGAFMAPLGHIAARLHAIGAQARQSVAGDAYKPMILVCAHAGLKTGEDGPTHADPQALQLLQENFPLGTADHADALGAAGDLDARRRPRSRSGRRVIAPFVTRPNETVLDRAALGLAPPEAAASGVYVLRRPNGDADVTVVLQESAVTYAFVQEALPLLEQDGHRRAGLLRRQRRALRPAARRTEQRAGLPRGARRRGDRHHRLHPADAVPLGALRRRPRRKPAPVPPRALPGQRPGRGGARRGRAGRAEPVRGRQGVPRQPRPRGALERSPICRANSPSTPFIRGACASSRATATTR